MDADVELDCRGMLCPLPIIRLANHHGDLADDGVPRFVVRRLR